MCVVEQKLSFVNGIGVQIATKRGGVTALLAVNGLH